MPKTNQRSHENLTELPQREQQEIIEEYARNKTSLLKELQTLQRENQALTSMLKYPSLKQPNSRKNKQAGSKDRNLQHQMAYIIRNEAKTDLKQYTDVNS